MRPSNTVREPPNVVVYRESLLPSSETFVANHVESLTQFAPTLVGLERVAGLSPGVPTVVASDARFGRLTATLLKGAGVVSPSLHRTLVAANPVLVHAHFGPDGVQAMNLAAKLNVPLIVTFHGYDATLLEDAPDLSRSFRLYLRRRESLARRGSLFIAVSNFIAGRIATQGFPRNRIVTHYLGVRLPPRAPVSREQREPFILFVGRLVENKGCHHLIEACAAVRKVKPEVKLVIIGDGPLRDQLENLAVDLKVDAHFLGRQIPQIVESWMEKALIFCVPSLETANGASEGFGLVFAEAQARGLPVVSTRTGGIPEAVVDGETGFLVSQRGAAPLVEPLLVLLDDEEVWMRLSRAGHARIVKSFDLTSQTRGLEKLYERVLARQQC